MCHVVTPLLVSLLLGCLLFLGTGFLFKSLSCLIELPKYLLKNWPYELSLVNLTAFLLLTGSVCSVALL